MILLQLSNQNCIFLIKIFPGAGRTTRSQSSLDRLHWSCRSPKDSVTEPPHFVSSSPKECGSTPSWQHEKWSVSLTWMNNQAARLIATQLDAQPSDQSGQPIGRAPGNRRHHRGWCNTKSYDSLQGCGSGSTLIFLSDADPDGEFPDPRSGSI